MDGNRLRAWREGRGYTLAEISGLSGYSVPMLSRVERGQRRLSPAAKVLVARRLGVDIAEIFPIIAGVAA